MYSFKKIKRNNARIFKKNSKSSVNNKMIEYSKINFKLSDRQLKQLKTVAKNKTGTTLRMSLKMLDGNDLPQELLLITRQKIKLRNTFNNNKSTDLKLSKA